MDAKGGKKEREREKRCAFLKQKCKVDAHKVSSSYILLIFANGWFQQNINPYFSSFVFM